MANYRIGDIVRLTRKSIGMSQEELAFQAGVATETISRIESGKHKMTQATYQKVMEPLNRFMERSYAVCTSSEMGIVEEKKLLEDTALKFEHEKAADYLVDLKDRIDDNNINRQYIMRFEAWIAYHRQEIDAEEMAKRLEEALKITIDNYQDYMYYKKYHEDGYPFTELEILTLMNLASAYDECDLTEKAEMILHMLLDCLDSGYVGANDTANLKLVIKSNLTRVMQGQGRYEDSIKLLEDVLEEAVRRKYGSMISHASYDITWNMLKINEISETNRYSLEEVKRKKRQTYYIAAARNDKRIKQITKKSYENLFHEEIELH